MRISDFPEETGTLKPDDYLLIDSQRDPHNPQNDRGTRKINASSITDGLLNGNKTIAALNEFKDKVDPAFPATASASNQLVTNTQLQSAIANPIFKDANQGNFETYAELTATGVKYYNAAGDIVSKTKNDYTFVTKYDLDGKAPGLARYIVSETQDGDLVWAFQVRLSDTVLTQEQMDALNSGINNATLVDITSKINTLISNDQSKDTKIETIETNITNIQNDIEDIENDVKDAQNDISDLDSNKLDKNQGLTNAGKLLGIAQNGDVEPIMFKSFEKVTAFPSTPNADCLYFLTADITGYSSGLYYYNNGWKSISSGGEGASSYSDLDNKPQINSVELIGNKSAADLGLVSTTQLATIDTALKDFKTKNNEAKLMVVGYASWAGGIAAASTNGSSGNGGTQRIQISWDYGKYTLTGIYVTCNDPLCYATISQHYTDEFDYWQAFDVTCRNDSVTTKYPTVYVIGLCRRKDFDYNGVV